VKNEEFLRSLYSSSFVAATFPNWGEGSGQVSLFSGQRGVFSNDSLQMINDSYLAASLCLSLFLEIVEFRDGGV